MAFIHPKNNLTLSQIGDELKNITSVQDKTGFLYFLENFIIVEHPAGYASMKDSMFPWQRHASPLLLNSRYVISKKRRQVGYSTLVGAYALWRALFYESQIISVVSLKLNDATVFLRRLKFIYDHLPIWMRQSKSEDMKTSITFKHNNSKINSLPLTDNPARGDTLSLLILDEFAMMKNAKDVLASAVPSLAAGAHIPFTNKTLPSQLFIISTYPENPIGNEYVRILNMAREGFDNKYTVVDVDPIGIPYYQDENWLKEQLDLLGPKRYAVELLGEEPLDSENALLPAHVLQNLKSKDPIRCDFLLPTDIDEEGYYKDLNAVTKMLDEFDASYNYIKGLWVWNDPEAGHEYVITCDVAKGAGGNNDAFIVVDIDTLEQVAEYINNKVDLETFKKVIEIVAKYYNMAKVSVENNSMGQGIVEYFSNVINYEKFYFHRKSKKVYTPGFPMNIQTRSTAIVNMQSILVNNELTLKSLRIINELRAFGYTNNGRIAALSGKDDLVMCLCQYSYLVGAGWAVSDKCIADELPLGFLGDGNFEEDQNKNLSPKTQELRERPIYKYWESKFDLNDDKREILDSIVASGLTISDEEIENMLD